MLGTIDFDAHAIDILQQLRLRFRDQIDNPEFKRVRCRDIDGLTNRFFRPVDVSAAQFRQAANICDGIIDRLALHGGGARIRGFRFFPGFFVACLFVLFVLLIGFPGTITPDLHRCRRTDIRCRRHRRNMAGVHDIGTGACGPGSGGRDIYDHRHRRLQNGFDNIPHRRIQAARCIHLDNHQFGVLARGIRDAFAQIVAGCRPDGAIDRQQVGDLVFLRCRGHGQQTRE